MPEAHRVAFAAARRQVDERAGIAAAVPIATAAVPIIAWCSLPIDIARTSRSTSPAFTRLPLDAT